MGRFTCMGWVTLFVAVACSSSVAPAARRSVGAQQTDTGSDAGSAGRDPSDGGSTPACDPDPNARVICDPSSVNSASLGAEVLVRRGTGSAPSPTGGTLVPGSYQLVSETLYGSPDPNTTAALPGDHVQRVLSVDCDVANEVYAQSSAGPVTSLGGGNDCWRLDSHPLSLVSVSGVMGPGITDLQDHVAYTARGGHLLVHHVYPYWDRPRFAILGSYTYVDDFVLAPAAAPDETKAGGAPPPPTTGRDPRCPATPPSDGDPCSPDPAPLECEYGGDAFGQCTTFAECALSFTDGVFRFSVAAPSACAPTNPTGCPATFSAAMAMATQNPGGSGPTCNYAEGACGCVVPRGGADIGGSPPCNWMCRSGTGADWLKSGCPWPRPLAGDPCPAGLECDYDAACSGEPSLGPAMTCENGYWAELGDECL